VNCGRRDSIGIAKEEREECGETDERRSRNPGDPDRSRSRRYERADDERIACSIEAQ
jgi:hypothetical protein